MSNKVTPIEGKDSINLYSYDNSSISTKISNNDSNNNNNNIISNNTNIKSLIDPKNNRYPYCLVWTPLPLITAILPCIGHVGICTSDGIIHDFSGPFYVSRDEMAFGNPTKFVLLNNEEFIIDKNEWDKAVKKGTNNYFRQNYSFCFNNCHSYCAKVLNYMKYKGKNNWNMINIWWIINTKSKYVSWKKLVQTYVGFFIFVGIILFMINLNKL
jgi:hypothetical protein